MKWNEIVFESNIKELYANIESDYKFTTDFLRNVDFKDKKDSNERAKKNKRISDFINRLLKASEVKHWEFDSVVELLYPTNNDKHTVPSVQGLMKVMSIDLSKM
jgi:hypothetical protein